MKRKVFIWNFNLGLMTVLNMQTFNEGGFEFELIGNKSTKP